MSRRSRQVRGRGPTRRVAAVVLSAFALGLGVVVFACGYDELGTAPKPVIPPDGAMQLEASPIPLGDSSMTMTDAPVDSPMTSKGCPPGLPGPAMIAIGTSFCIDATEVTNKDYEQFLAATKNGALDAGIPDGGLPTVCGTAAKKTFLRSGSADGGDPKKPVGRVAWCDAVGYCAYAGKRLCDGPDGGVAGRRSGEWYEACSANDTRGYPYGDAQVANACNDTPPGPMEVATQPGCVGGSPGLFDMVGNVQEWVTTCDDVGGSCDTAGGSYISGAAFSNCPQIEQLPREYTNDALGFRCCADYR